MIKAQKARQIATDKNIQKERDLLREWQCEYLSILEERIKSSADRGFFQVICQKEIPPQIWHQLLDLGYGLKKTDQGHTIITWERR